MDNYTAEFETIVGIIRVFPPGKTFDDPFSWCCTIKRIDKETCEFCGVLKAPTISELKAVIQILKEAGFKKARWLRIKNGKYEWKEFDSQR